MEGGLLAVTAAAAVRLNIQGKAETKMHLPDTSGWHSGVKINKLSCLAIETLQMLHKVDQRKYGNKTYSERPKQIAATIFQSN